MKSTGSLPGFAAAALFTLCVPSTVAATVITFDFNALPNNANNAAVQTHMQGVINAALPGQGSGFTISWAKATTTYTGDGHVTGPSDSNRIHCTGPASNRTCVEQTRASYSETLGTSDYGVHHAAPNDTFLINISTKDRIKMVFPFAIYSVSFDFQIFPDAACSNGFSTNCNDSGDANWPDFKFIADGIQQIEWVGVNPADMTEAVLFRQSPASGWGKNEKAPQLLSVSGLFSFTDGVTTLEFVDWPSTIGIDNLVINTRRPPEETPGVPEPSTLALLGIALAGLGVFRSRRPRQVV